eukprot:m.460925 g.460925  ORF g.460925 m.460925 type:complete len:691 (+) comp22172_c0_seq1:81-2153(+)
MVQCGSMGFSEAMVAAWLGAVAAADVEMVDVLVYSANAAGVGAAVTASNNSKFKVKVMEPLEMIGGMAAAGGVALMNQGGCGLSGLSRNWSLLCGEYYFGYPTLMTPTRAPFPSMNVSEMAFWTLLRSQESISVLTGCRAVSVTRSTAGAEGCLNQVDFLCSNDTKQVSIQATYIIDASYDGDIMTMAGGIDYTSGREAKDVYNESLAGVILHNDTLESFVKQNLTISPYFPNGTMLPYIDSDPLAPLGSGDNRVMSYQFFACLSDTPGNMVPFYPPPHYDPEDFTLLLRTAEAAMANGMYPKGPPISYFGAVQCYDEVVQKVTGNRDCLYCCGTSPFDPDQPDLNRGWPSANHTRRTEITQAHRYYLQGFLYFMANDPRMPNATRASAQNWGYCKDEYKRFDNFPPQLYIRNSNRLQGESLLTQNNIVNPQSKSDGVAMGCWTFDQHTMSRHAVPNPTRPGEMMVINEGFFRAALGSEGLLCDDPLADCSEGSTWYDVPFGAMTPKRGQASNLLIPVVISTTSVAYASTRIENMFMDLGSAAGVAVAQLLTSGSQNIGTCPEIPVQDTKIAGVQDVLTRVYGQHIHGNANPPEPPAASWYQVVGSGTSEWDGFYHAVPGASTDGRQIFRSNSTATCSLYSYARVWRLGIENHEIFYVAGSPTSDRSPPLTGWQVANGTSPAPHLICGKV